MSESSFVYNWLAVRYGHFYDWFAAWRDISIDYPEPRIARGDA